MRTYSHHNHRNSHGPVRICKVKIEVSLSVFIDLAVIAHRVQRWLHHSWPSKFESPSQQKNKFLWRFCELKAPELPLDLTMHYPYPICTDDRRHCRCLGTSRSHFPVPGPRRSLAPPIYYIYEYIAQSYFTSGWNRIFFWL